MKKFIYFLTLLFHSILFSLLGQTNSKHTYVKDYYRKDGTHVQGHYRTEKNNTNSDNFSTKGNTNPYTGQAGWIESDDKTPYSNSTSYPSVNSNTYSSTYNSSNYSYNDPSKYEGKTNSLGEKVITYKNGQEVFGLCKGCNDVVYNEKFSYYWYTPYSGIQKTTGGNGGTLLHGEYKFYDENGKLLAKRNYNKGLEHGDHIAWSENGSIKEKSHYVNGTIDYLKFKNDEGYIIEWTGDIFKKGSVKKVFSLSGILEQKSDFFEDFKSKFTSFYSSGKIKSTFTLSIGDFYYGPYTEYYESGKLKFQAFFNEDAFETGEWKWYKEDGTLEHSRKFKYIEDKYSNGQLKEKGSYVFYDEEWVKNGRWFYYNEEGKLTDTFEFDYGKVKEPNK